MSGGIVMEPKAAAVEDMIRDRLISEGLLRPSDRVRRVLLGMMPVGRLSPEEVSAASNDLMEYEWRALETMLTGGNRIDALESVYDEIEIHDAGQGHADRIREIDQAIKDAQDETDRLELERATIVRQIAQGGAKSYTYHVDDKTVDEGGAETYTTYLPHVLDQTISEGGAE